MLWQREWESKEPDPVRCCCNCGKEFHGGGHWSAWEAGWEGFSKPILVKQLDGTKRKEFIGCCPECVKAEDKE